MSKIRKTETGQQTRISEVDVKFQKILNFSGLLFLIASIGSLLLIIGLDLLNIIETYKTLNKTSFVFILFTGVSAAFALFVSIKIKKSENKRNVFFDWILAQFLLCAISIISLSVYQW